jgi:hypothetical protein
VSSRGKPGQPVPKETISSFATAVGLPVEKDVLQFGDVAFQGRGINDAPVDVGVELWVWMCGWMRRGRGPVAGWEKRAPRSGAQGFLYDPS